MNEPVQDTEGARRDASDRRRLAEIFGDVLPDTDVLPDITANEHQGSAAEQRESNSDSWYLRNRPPHHG